jgi:hypothetical protein
MEDKDKNPQGTNIEKPIYRFITTACIISVINIIVFESLYMTSHRNVWIGLFVSFAVLDIITVVYIWKKNKNETETKNTQVELGVGIISNAPQEKIRQPREGTNASVMYNQHVLALLSPA